MRKRLPHTLRYGSRFHNRCYSDTEYTQRTTSPSLST